LQRKKRVPRIRVNERILYNTEEVRVIGAEGEQLGVMKTRDAIRKAKDTGHELVEVSPNTKPPVCRILDYGKYKYNEAKKAKAAKAKQHVVKLKEIKFHPKTDVNDYSYRLERGKEFLKKGYKLKATVVFRGRELAHVEYGSRWLKQMEVDLQGIGDIESPLKQEGRNFSITFGPAKQISAKIKKKSEAKPAPELTEEGEEKTTSETKENAQVE